jgi:hypothetical protein
VVPASEDDEDDNDVAAMLVDPPQPQSFAEQAIDSAQNDPADMLLEDDAPNKGVPETASPPKSLPSHRARAANPLVKMVDDFGSMDGAISVKARLQGRNGTSSDAPVAGPSSTPTRKSGRKPGPGRSSGGMLNKNTSSLLTFEKGALKTVKGKFKAPVGEEDKAEGGSGLPDIPVSPPTSDELLKLSGFDSKAAEALDDFEEDDTTAPPKETTDDVAIQQQRFA